MLITDHFVYVHLPKTGGTFVETVLKRLHEKLQPGIARRTVRQFRGGLPRGYLAWKPHGLVCEIPREHAEKPILATIRNPYDRYVSQYEYPFFRNNPRMMGSVTSLKARWPEFPEFTFPRWVEFANQELVRIVNRNFPPGDELGWHTFQLAQYYFPDPLLNFASIDEEFLQNKTYRALTHRVHFIPMERLNEALYEFLARLGYPASEIEFIRSEAKIHPPHSNRSEKQSWESYYTPELKAFVRQRERMLFEMFPEYDR